MDLFFVFLVMTTALGLLFVVLGVIKSSVRRCSVCDEPMGEEFRDGLCERCSKLRRFP